MNTNRSFLISHRFEPIAVIYGGSTEELNTKFIQAVSESLDGGVILNKPIDFKTFMPFHKPIEVHVIINDWEGDYSYNVVISVDHIVIY